jgi:pheromone shutdown protein TraB
MNSGPQTINSGAHDSVIRIKHSLWHDIMPVILKKYPGYETLIDDYNFEKQQWLERNKIMADNIVKAAKEYPTKRLVVVTGATHRYTLRDLLKDVNSIDLKEYWEITSPKIEKTAKPDEPNQQQKK